MELKEYLEQLEYLVNIDSGTFDVDGVNKIVQYFSKAFKDLGWIVEETTPADKKYGNCLICKNREAEHYDLFMIGHLDTVYEKGTCAKRPFSIVDDKAFGPGVSDMKHGALMMYYLLKELPKEQYDKLNIVAVFNPDEEIGSYFSKTVYTDYAKISDYAFVYEASNEETGSCTARKGAIGCEVEFIGKAGHCAYVATNGAVSAIHEMGKWIAELDGVNDLEIGTTLNVGLASGGTGKNVVADRAEIGIDMRFAVPSEYQKFVDTVNNLTKKATERGIKINLTMRQKLPLTPNEKALNYIKHVEQLCKDNGIDFKHSARGGLSDANIISQYGPICIDGLGPTGNFVHSEKEYLVISSIMPYFELSKLLIKDLADNKN